MLKALISAHNRKYPLSQSLEMLGDIVAQCDETLPDTPYDLLSLEPFAVEHRYDIGGGLGELDRIAIRESIALLREYVLARIVAIEASLEP